ncbi:hypothetical protein NPIL_101571 [Nephila pilipes]|uniref:Uncharacterized protein n=1 Tax=Nephila pilipes TaxID=299642 RepID=A0A8X6U3F4_NEPPI|nr:hypothetical protein NPIL_101571 [Nephila pilipes]
MMREARHFTLNSRLPRNPTASHYPFFFSPVAAEKAANVRRASVLCCGLNWRHGIDWKKKQCSPSWLSHSTLLCGCLCGVRDLYFVRLE